MMTRMYLARSGSWSTMPIELFNRERKTHVVQQRRYIVQTGRYAGRPAYGSPPRLLFKAAVQIADWTSESLTVSPSMVRIGRTVPWVAGCDGPMLIVIGSVRQLDVSDSSSSFGVELVHQVLRHLRTRAGPGILPRSCPGVRHSKRELLAGLCSGCCRTSTCLSVPLAQRVVAANQRLPSFLG